MLIDYYYSYQQEQILRQNPKIRHKKIFHCHLFKKQPFTMSVKHGEKPDVTFTDLQFIGTGTSKDCEWSDTY